MCSISRCLLTPAIGLPWWIDHFMSNRCMVRFILRISEENSWPWFELWTFKHGTITPPLEYIYTYSVLNPGVWRGVPYPYGPAARPCTCGRTEYKTTINHTLNFSFLLERRSPDPTFGGCWGVLLFTGRDNVYGLPSLPKLGARSFYS